MIGFDEAVALIAANCGPREIETVALRQAHGRTLAAAVDAQVRAPPFDASAMDGYAVREADLAELPAKLKVIGESFAGAPFAGAIGQGECVRIFTGAAVPTGADRVIVQEVVERGGDEARFSQMPGAARHIRGAGSDFELGDRLLDKGRRLDTRAMVAAAAADLAQVRVWKRPRVSILATGDELAEPGTARASPGAIPESVSLGIAALARDWGGEVIASIRLRDDLEAMEQVAARVLGECDLIIVTGGASVGEKDFAKAMFAPSGLDLIFSKVAIKPGKPVWLGRAGATVVMGLPGNPTSALVTARLFLAPLLARLSGQVAQAALEWRPAPLAAPLGKGGTRETFHRGRWKDGAVEILSNQDSSAQKVLAEADLLIRQRANAPALAAGDAVETLAF